MKDKNVFIIVLAVLIILGIVASQSILTNVNETNNTTLNNTTLNNTTDTNNTNNNTTVKDSDKNSSSNHDKSTTKKSSSKKSSNSEVRKKGKDEWGDYEDDEWVYGTTMDPNYKWKTNKSSFGVQFCIVFNGILCKKRIKKLEGKW